MIMIGKFGGSFGKRHISQVLMANNAHRI